MTTSPSLGDILIDDDDTNITDLLRVNLRSEGYGVSVCPVAEDVDRNALDSTVLVIVDAMKQPYSGMDLIYDLKEDPATEHMAVILYSPVKSERMVIDALDAGLTTTSSSPSRSVSCWRASNRCSGATEASEGPHWSFSTSPSTPSHRL